MKLAALGAFVLLASCGDRPVKPAGETQETRVRPEITIKSLDKPGSLVVENHGPTRTLSKRIAVEARREGRWEDTEIDMKLETRCEEAEPPQACVELPSGATMAPVSWDGHSCGGQCRDQCPINSYIGPGTFRFALTSCDGKQRWEGAPFDLPAQPPPPGTPDAKK